MIIQGDVPFLFSIRSICSFYMFANKNHPEIKIYVSILGTLLVTPCAYVLKTTSQPDKILFIPEQLHVESLKKSLHSRTQFLPLLMLVDNGLRE